MPEKKLARRTRDETVLFLEFIAGALALPPEAKEAQRLALAARVGLSPEVAARIFGKTPAAAKKALERARKK